MTSYDLVIVGAGPAGMGAAIAARAWNLSVLVLDEQTAPGGQIYRGIEDHADRHARLDPHSATGLELVRQFRASGAEHRSGATVWFINPTGEIAYSVGGQAHRVTARRVLFATGAMERPWPFPGWTLPGVMTVGGAQILLKTAGLVHRDAVLAGAGPLLFLVAAQYLRLGVPVRAVLDTTPAGQYARAMRYAGAAARGHVYLRRGVGWLWQLYGARVPLFMGVSDLRAVGRDAVEAVEFQQRGRRRRLDVTGLFVHQGVVPHIHAALAAGCERRWDEGGQCWRIVADPVGRTSQPTMFVAGDAAAITGAASAPLRGRLAALAIAHDLGALGEDDFETSRRRWERDLARDAAVRPFLETLYRPAPGCIAPADPATLVCRCEDIRAIDVLQFVRNGGRDPNQLKSGQRCGMGPCQGRMCALAVANMLARERTVERAIVPTLRQRPPVVPVPLDELAGLLDEGGVER